MTSTTRFSLRPVVVPEARGWSLFIPGAPVAGDGLTFDFAVDEFIAALREYVADWDRLRTGTNHRGNWELVKFVALSTDDELRDWVTGAGSE
jgi:hypothetical protein